mmetsp:Transcript_18926/g.34304  ORF Transcript_18926/g.34304 Transcript_18926/m.34304 type:complete len:234 (+) Transcript_18926:744-1445(+)
MHGSIVNVIIRIVWRSKLARQEASFRRAGLQKRRGMHIAQGVCTRQLRRVNDIYIDSIRRKVQRFQRHDCIPIAALIIIFIQWPNDISIRCLTIKNCGILVTFSVIDVITGPQIVINEDGCIGWSVAFGFNSQQELCLVRFKEEGTSSASWHQDDRMILLYDAGEHAFVDGIAQVNIVTWWKYKAVHLQSTVSLKGKRGTVGSFRHVKRFLLRRHHMYHGRWQCRFYPHQNPQ